MPPRVVALADYEIIERGIGGGVVLVVELVVSEHRALVAASDGSDLLAVRIDVSLATRRYLDSYVVCYALGFTASKIRV